MSAWPLAPGAAYDMDMGTAAGALEETGNEDLVLFKNHTADRAHPVTASAEAVNAALYVHETILAAVQRREGH